MKRILHIILLFTCANICHAVMAQDKSSEKNHNYEVARQLETFSAIYKQLDMMYVDTLDPAVTVNEGIKRMLRSLDPYTEYYPEDEVKDLKSMLTGKYAGIGAIIKYNLRIDRVVIDEPYENMPAAEAGLKKGDIILAIDDSSMVGKGTSYVSSRLRGEPGTTFMLKIMRESDASRAKAAKGPYTPEGKIMKMKVTRRSIQMPSVTYYGLLGDGVGYLSLSQYTEDCARDMRRALVEMRQKGMTSLIFDIRNNGGGSLSEAIDIVNMFVPKNITLVTTKGKLKSTNMEYKTSHEPLDTVMPLVVLTNGNSASASEITSGSLQDLDRAVIMGQRTYGKGLVQRPVDLPHGGSLKLTTSKYYIPSGRCIQAINYKHTGGGYKEHIPDSLTHEFTTRGGRKVRDGGGIKPDVELEQDTLPNILVYLQQSGLDSTEVMHYYVLDYISRHATIAQPSEFRITDADYADFKQRVIEAGFKFDRETGDAFDDLVKMAKFEGYYDDAKEEFAALKEKLQHNLSRELDSNRTEIQRLIENNIVTAYYYQKGAMAHSLTGDKEVKAAKELLIDRERYNNILHPQPTLPAAE